MTGKNVLLTGGAGYLGSVIDHMMTSRGDAVVVVDKQFGLDVSWVAQYYIHEFDVVIHLAAKTNVLECQKDLQYTLIENCDKTVELSRKLLPTQHFIFTSTSAVYGDAGGRKVGWNDTSPNTYYAMSKLMAEKSIKHPKTTILRLATLWGKSPHMRTGMFIYDAVKEMEDKGIARCFDPITLRPYMNVRDAAKEIIRMVDGEITGHFDIGTETLRKIDVIRPLANYYDIETIIRSETKFKQNFVMRTDYDGDKFLDFYGEVL